MIGDLEERLALALARSWVPSPPLSRVERQLQRGRLAHRLERMATEWGERREETRVGGSDSALRGTPGYH